MPVGVAGSVLFLFWIVWDYLGPLAFVIHAFIGLWRALIVYVWDNNLKTFLVLIITFVALIIIVDTFKIQIITFYPEIDDLLNSLYQTLTDINLFFKDLIK